MWTRRAETLTRRGAARRADRGGSQSVPLYPGAIRLLDGPLGGRGRHRHPALALHALVVDGAVLLPAGGEIATKLRGRVLLVELHPLPFRFTRAGREDQSAGDREEND